MASTSRIFANTITFQMSAESNGTVDTEPGGIGPQLLEIDNFTWTWKAERDKSWPSGASKARNLFMDGDIEVTMTGGQVDTGFFGVVNAQRQALKTGQQPPKIDLLRTARDSTGAVLFVQKFDGGISNTAKGSQADGNKQISNEITFIFDDMGPTLQTTF